MNKKISEYLASIGAKGGSVSSPVKTKAARENAKKPRKKKKKRDASA